MDPVHQGGVKKWWLFVRIYYIKDGVRIGFAITTGTGG